MQLAIIADDLTGAADAAACFADRELDTRISLNPEKIVDADVTVICTDTREMAAVGAATILRGIGSKLRILLPPDSFVYKKIDSTLRGPCDAELAALMSAIGCSKALIAPAFPNQSRSTIRGRQYVDGQPLSSTSFGSEVPSDDLSKLFQRTSEGSNVLRIPLDVIRQGPATVAKILNHRHRVFIGDAETERDLETLAHAAVQSDIRLLCGSAGLARALPHAIELNHRKDENTQQSVSSGPILVVVGSRHERTIAQVAACRQSGIAVIDLPKDFGSTEAQEKAVADDCLREFNTHSSLILTSHELPTETERQQIADTLGSIAASIVQSQELGGLVLTGGQTALAVCTALNVDSIRVQGEWNPGVARGTITINGKTELPIVTKAGAFGTPITLIEACDFLLR